MDTKHAYDPTDSRYYDEKDLRSEVERVFSLCADCRMCVKFCGSFPKMFDAIDDYCTEGKYAEVDTKKLKTEDLKQIVDLCFQCKLCYIKCPYTPDDHEWSIDFLRLIARAKAQEVKKQGVSFNDKLLGNPDLLGKIGTATAPIANWANENPLNRQLMQSVAGIHKDRKLRPFASTTFAAQFAAHQQPIHAEPSAKIAFFSTCYVNYNEPQIGLDTLEVMARNNVDVSFAPTLLRHAPVAQRRYGIGRRASAKERRGSTSLRPRRQDHRRNQPDLLANDSRGYPRLLGTEDAKKIAVKTSDPMEFLAHLAAQGKLNRNFKTSAGQLSYHMPCHLRAQNVGYKTRDVLALLPDTKIKLVEECSGHDGTWAMKTENFPQSLKWGRRAFDAISEGDPKMTCSDCPLAAIQIEQGAGRRPMNPMQILAKSYRGEAID